MSDTIVIKYLHFTTLQGAIDHRESYGTGGYIFSPEDHNEAVILFPHVMTPGEICLHPLTKGLSGAIL